MPVKNFLSPHQQEKLQQLARQNPCPRLREHAWILLLRQDGKTYRQIADFLGCSYRTVAHWCKQADLDKLETLQDQRHQGNHHKATPEYIQLLLETVDQQPRDWGYEFGRWSTQRLATHLAQATGIQLSGSQISRILAQKK